MSDKNLSGSSEDRAWSSPSGGGEPGSKLDSASLNELLDTIVNASGANGESPVADPDLQQQLQHVATSHAGQPLTLSPVLTSIIEIIARRFGVLTENQRSLMVTDVARTLYDDSESRNRLERLWKSLQEASA